MAQMPGSSPPYVMPARVGQAISQPREVFALMKRGLALIQEPLPEGAAASTTPSYYILVDLIRRPVSSSAARTAINSGRIGHGIGRPDGGFMWMQTTSTP